MPALENAKWERFAQELAGGKSAAEAYELAGYKYNDGNCIRLKGNERITARVAEILERGAIRAEVTVASILTELEEARQFAISLEQPAAVISAIMGKAKVKGLIVDRKEVGDPGEFEAMADSALLGRLREIALEFSFDLPVSDTQH